MADTPTTEAGQRLVAAMPYHTATEKGLWGRLIVAIEAEAVAAERARIRRDVEALRDEEWRDCIGNCHDQSLAAVLAIIGDEP